MYHLHRLSLEVGRRLSAAGVVDRPDDVFLLSLRGVTRHSSRIAPAKPAGPDSSRRAEMEYFRSVPVPPRLALRLPEPHRPTRSTLALLNSSVHHRRQADDHTVIRGNCGSPGRATGPARIVHSLAGAGKLQPPRRAGSEDHRSTLDAPFRYRRRGRVRYRRHSQPLRGGCARIRHPGRRRHRECDRGSYDGQWSKSTVTPPLFAWSAKGAASSRL